MRTRALQIALVALAALSGARQRALAAEAPFRLPVGDVALEMDDARVDETLGGAFAPGLRSGARNCYVAAQLHSPETAGEIAFTLTPPPGEGRYGVTLRPTEEVAVELVACVRALFDEFYHYKDKLAFDHFEGTLRFTPHSVEAPPEPDADAERVLLERRYAGAGVVRIVAANRLGVGLEVSGNEVFRRSAYDVELEFLMPGYETACTHYGPYKVFSAAPYTNRYSGHSCESTARRAGDRTTDAATVVFRLALGPDAGRGWEAREESLIGTLPTGD